MAIKSLYTQISRHVHFLLLNNFLRYTPWGHLSGCRNVDMSLHVTSTWVIIACTKLINPFNSSGYRRHAIILLVYTYKWTKHNVLYFVISFSQFALMLCTSLMYADSASQETDGSRRETNMEMKRPLLTFKVLPWDRVPITGFFKWNCPYLDFQLVIGTFQVYLLRYKWKTKQNCGGHLCLQDDRQ